MPKSYYPKPDHREKGTVPRSSVDTRRPSFFSHCEKPPERTLSHSEKQLYLDRILPTVYAELYMLRPEEKHQVLTSLRQELMYWGGLDNTQIESRLVAR